MGREAQRSEQEHCSPVSIYMDKLDRERFVQIETKMHEWPNLPKE